MRVAVIGCGGHSRQHGGALRGLAELGYDVDLAAVCDLDADRAEAYRADYSFAAAYTDMHRMVAAVQPEALVLETPMALNVPLALKMLCYRIPLLVEKPPGQSEQETRELAREAEAAGVRVMVSFDRRFDHAATVAKSWLETASLSPLFAEARMLRKGRSEKAFVQNTGIHLIDLIHFLVGYTTEVHAHAVSGDRNGTAAVGRLNSQRGCVTSFAILPDVGTEAESVVIHGNGFSLFLDRMRGSLEVFRAGERVANVDPPSEGPSAQTHENEMRTFFDCLRDNVPFPSTLEDGMAAVRVTGLIAGQIAADAGAGAVSVGSCGGQDYQNP